MNVPLYTDEGLRVLLAEDLFIYVVNESDKLVYVYSTEIWPEWIEVAPNFEEIPVTALIPYAHKHQPDRLAKINLNYCTARSSEDQMTFAEWEQRHKAVQA